MSLLQKVFKAIFPTERAQAMEAESRLWMVRCSCGFARSIWDLGGIRWKAAGQPRRFMKCSLCGKRSWHNISRDQ